MPTPEEGPVVIARTAAAEVGPARQGICLARNKAKAKVKPRKAPSLPLLYPSLPQLQGRQREGSRCYGTGALEPRCQQSTREITLRVT
jgi:hypothetical protein